MKYFVMFILSFCCNASAAIRDDSWNYTHFVYLVKPIYIFKVQSVVTPIAGKLDNSLKDLVIKVHEKQESLNTVHYYFEIKNVLYGEEKNIYHLEYHYKGEYKECNLDDNFNDHKDINFWNKDIGRSISTNWPYNHSIYTCFDLDKQYLLIGNAEFGKKQYEIIKSSDDEWFRYVSKKVKTIVPFKKLIENIKKDK